MEKVSKEFLMFQREKNGEGLVINGKFHKWRFFGDTERDLRAFVESQNAKCIAHLIPFTVINTAINGVRYKDTMKWCFCSNCDSETFERFDDEQGGEE